MGNISLLYRRDMRAAWRERGVWLGSLILPVILGPVALWLLVSAVGLTSGEAEQSLPRLGVWEASVDASTSSFSGPTADLPGPPGKSAARGPDDHDAHSLQARLMKDPGLIVESLSASDPWAEILGSDRFDAILEILPPEGAATRLAGNRRLRLGYDASKDRSLVARDLVAGHIAEHRDHLLQEQASVLGLSPAAWQVVTFESRNMASGGAVGSFVLGLLVPLFTIIMVAVGCLFPAIETIAGERERRTWETTLSLAVPRHQILLAKYFYVASCGAVAGLLNLTAVTLSMRAILAPVLGLDGGGLSFEIPLRALPLIVLCTVLTALFVAAGMMMCAAFARTFKEGQALVSPFLLLCLLPLLAVQSPELQLDPWWAMVPIANVALLFRQLIGGVFAWDLIVLTLSAAVAWIGLCLLMSRFLLASEDLWLEGREGGLVAALRFRLGARGRDGLGGRHD